jgi:hypothetical protein
MLVNKVVSLRGALLTHEKFNLFKDAIYFM